MNTKRIILVLFIVAITCTNLSAQYAEWAGIAKELAIFTDASNQDNLPSLYRQKIRADFKQNTAIGLSLNGYSTLFSLSSWPDDSGGPVHQFAMSEYGIYYRVNSGNTWLSWRKLPIPNLSGNIGIGTDYPQAKLEISGDAIVQGRISAKEIRFMGADGGDNSDPYTLRKIHDSENKSHLDLNLNDDADESFRIYGNSCNGYNCGAYSGNLYHSFDASGNVYHAGNVGIGTTNPQYKLDVKGQIRATEVLVQSVDQFADFVFDKDYRLPSLHEVNTFIQDNGHLPGIPSAQEVKENGMSIVEMQVKLLQKVEELTLYSIKQQEEIKALKDELDKLKKK